MRFSSQRLRCSSTMLSGLGASPGVPLALSSFSNHEASSSLIQERFKPIMVDRCFSLAGAIMGDSIWPLGVCKRIG